MEKISRDAARAAGLKRYFTGEPCKHGHIVERHVINMACVECTRVRLREAYRADPAAAAAASKARRNKDPDRRKMLERAQRERRKEKRKEHWAQYYAANKERLAQKSRQRRLEKPEMIKATLQRWNEKNPTAKRALESKRRARKRNAIPAWSGELDELVWQQAAHLAAMRQQCTGIEWQADHMLPLLSKTACGLHTWNNCQVIPRSLNQSKNNRMIFTEPGEWIRHL